MEKNLSKQILNSLNESVDVNVIYLENGSVLYKFIENLLGDEKIKEIEGYGFNDDEPVDFIVETVDGDIVYISTFDPDAPEIIKCKDKSEAQGYIFSDDANYNF